MHVEVPGVRRDGNGATYHGLSWLGAATEPGVEKPGSYSR
jgi:hypothetical protein